MRERFCGTQKEDDSGPLSIQSSLDRCIAEFVHSGVLVRGVESVGTVKKIGKIFFIFEVM
jgi:hypothetical protein